MKKMSNEEFASFVVRMHRYIMQKVREVEDREIREKLYLQSVIRTIRAEKYDFTAEQTAKLIEIMTDPGLLRPRDGDQADGRVGCRCRTLYEGGNGKMIEKIAKKIESMSGPLCGI